MAISTLLINQKTTEGLLTQQKQLYELQRKLSTGLRVEKASDDPLAKTIAMEANRSSAQTDQFNRNISSVRDQFNQVDTALQAGSNTMQSIKETLIAAGGAALSPSDYKSLATQLESSLKDLSNIANRKDTNGAYIFSGVNDSTAPFADVPPASTVTNYDTYYAYAGSNTNRGVQISSGKTIDQGVTGADLFMDSTNSTSYFSSVQRMIDALKTGNSATVKSTLNTELGTTDSIYDRYLTGLTKLGGRMKELDTVESLNTANSYEQQRVAGDAVNIDYTKAISDITQTQVALEAAQRSYAQWSKLSLFNFIS